MINVEKVSEGIDYELVPVDVENQQAWDVRFLKGPFVETIIRFGNVAINGLDECVNFNFELVSTPISELSTDSVDLQDAAGSILIDVIENAIASKSLVTEEKHDD